MTGVTALSWVNYAHDATITASSQVAGLEGSNVATDQGSEADAWQTADGVVTAATLTIAPATLQQAWRVFALARTNLTAGATVTITLLNYGSPSPVTVTTRVLSGPPNGRGQVVTVLSQVYTADYATIRIDDAANPDNHLSVGLVHCGALWIPEYGRTQQSSFEREERTDENVTIGGQEYPEHRWQRRVANLVFDATDATSELWQYLDGLDRTARTRRNILVIPDYTSVAIAYEAILGTLRVSAATYAMRTASRVSWSGRVTERL